MHHAYLDRFTIVRNCLVVDGWATDCDPKVSYAGQVLDAVWKRVDRPELEPIFGGGSRSWGFTLCALLPTEIVDQTLFSMQFSEGRTVENPGAHFSAPTDADFHAMWNGFLALANESGGRMLEVGSRDRSGNSYRSQFPGITEWVGLDVMDGPGVDVVGDAHCLSRQVDGKFDFAFSMAVFEHILMPWKVAIELNRVLKPGGRALIISHAGWPLHEEPWDFWRFSKESWRGLFNEHTGFRVIDAQYEFPARIVPDYVQSGDMVHMSHATTYLLSGCVVERTGDARVEWAAEAAEIYDLGYSYA